MNIICQYNKELECFLRSVVEYTLCKYGQELNLNNLQQIELIDISEFELQKDGTTYENGTKIIVTSRLSDMLPCFSIEQLENNSNFKMIVNTLYHEMGHITDWAKYPKLYKEADTMENKRVGLPALFWIEYLAEKRSCSKAEINNLEFCNQFVQRQWHAYYSSFDDLKESNFFYLNKVIPYFLARTIDLNIRKKYQGKIKNVLLDDYIRELRAEVENLEKILPFDEPDKLSGLYDIMDKYYKKFRHTYLPNKKWLF